MNSLSPLAMPLHLPEMPFSPDTCLSEVTDLPDWDHIFRQSSQPSLLLFSAEDVDTSHHAEAAAVAGFRILGAAPLHQAAARLSMVVDVDAVLVVCAGDEPGLDILLARLDMMAAHNGTMLSVVVDFTGLDRAHAIIGSNRATILCEPTLADLALAMSAMAAHSRNFERLNDSGRGANDIHIEKISDDLNRLTRTIEALVQNRMPSGFQSMPNMASGNPLVRSPERPYQELPSDMVQSAAPLDAQQVRAILRARRLRDHILSPDLFADPAWDILLDLMAAHLEKSRVSVSSLCIAASVPPTTALRWIRQLTEYELLERQADPDDGRRIFITLSDKGIAAVHRWFQESSRLLRSAAG